MFANSLSYVNRFPDNVAAQVTVSRMRSAIERVRSNMYPPVPASLADLGAMLNEHQHLSDTLDGTDNIFAGVVHGPGTTSLVFISRRMRRYMRRVRVVFCDGTFASRPNSPASAQVLQIVAEVDHHVSFQITHITDKMPTTISNILVSSSHFQKTNFI